MIILLSITDNTKILLQGDFQFIAVLIIISPITLYRFVYTS